MATSTIPALKANLVTQFTARAGLTGVQISYGRPLPNPQRESIWIGDVTALQEFGAMAAPNARHEVYDVRILISVLHEGTDTRATDERCFAIFAELETQIRSDGTVGGVVALAYFTAVQLSEFVSPDGMNRTAELATTLNCQAWI